MSEEKAKEDMLLWVDVETTGLDPDCDRILEVEMRCTDMRGVRCAGGFHRVVGLKGRKTEAEARALYAAIAGNPVELGRLQTALRRYKHAVNDGQIRTGHIPRLNTWLRDQWETWAPEPISPPPIHKHTWNCEHVHQLMDPHEDEYDHTGSLRNGNPSEWWKACQACAEDLNNQETSKEKQ